MNILQNNLSLSFENVEGMTKEEKIIIENIIEIDEHNLEDTEELTSLRKLSRVIQLFWTLQAIIFLQKIKTTID